MKKSVVSMKSVVMMKKVQFVVKTALFCYGGAKNSCYFSLVPVTSYFSLLRMMTTWSFSIIL